MEEGVVAIHHWTGVTLPVLLELEVPIQVQPHWTGILPPEAMDTHQIEAVMVATLAPPGNGYKTSVD